MKSLTWLITIDGCLKKNTHSTILTCILFYLVCWCCYHGQISPPWQHRSALSLTDVNVSLIDMCYSRGNENLKDPCRGKGQHECSLMNLYFWPYYHVPVDDSVDTKDRYKRILNILPHHEARDLITSHVAPIWMSNAIRQLQCHH